MKKGEQWIFVGGSAHGETRTYKEPWPYVKFVSPGFQPFLYQRQTFVYKKKTYAIGVFSKATPEQLADHNVAKLIREIRPEPLQK